MQLEFFDVPSPCIGICQTDDKGYCLGCMRTREERQSWLSLSCADRQKVIKRCRQRKRRRDNANKPKTAAEEVVIVQHSLLDPQGNPAPDTNKPRAGQERQAPLPEKNHQDPPSESQLQVESDMDFSDFEL